MDLDASRTVGPESRKSYADKISNGFFKRFLSGAAILDIGYKGGDPAALPIMPQATGVDLDYPGYDGKTLPFPDNSQDAVYTSHCLEHIEDYRSAIREWFRVLRNGGFLVVAVPHQFLYERRVRMPSAYNRDHKRFYTPSSLLKEIEDSLEPNSYRIRHLIDNDAGFEYEVIPPNFPTGCHEIELVVEKIARPRWDLEDGTSRHYAAHEFYTHLPFVNTFYLETDFSKPVDCPIYGPYQPLRAADWRAVYTFDVLGLGDQTLASNLDFDVALNMNRVAAQMLSGDEGASALRRGSLTLDFANAHDGAQVEFRVFTHGQVPFKGAFRFYGVSLQRLW